jgi:purine-binding chemotaxis protein CheW
MELPQQFLTFRLAERLCALPLAIVVRVIQAVEVTPLPAAPPVVLGILNLAGEVLPVFSLRRRFGLPDRPVKLSDQLIVAAVAGHQAAPRRVALLRVALLVDEVLDVLTAQAALLTETALQSLMPGLGLATGVVQEADELAVIYDLKAFLTAAEEVALEAALQRSYSQEQ